jgi:hypothetical protein
MKHILLVVSMAAFSTVFANEPLTNATVVNDMSKAPGIIPGKPTAEVGAPKYSIQVPCTVNEAGRVVCVDVDWAPVNGPAHYVLTPFKKDQPPVVVEKIVEKVVTVPAPLPPVTKPIAE